MVIEIENLIEAVSVSNIDYLIENRIQTATDPTKAITHQMENAAIKDAQNAAIAPADPHNPTSAQGQLTYPASSANQRVF